MAPSHAILSTDINKLASVYMFHECSLLLYFEAKNVCLDAFSNAWRVYENWHLFENHYTLITLTIVKSSFLVVTKTYNMYLVVAMLFCLTKIYKTS